MPKRVISEDEDWPVYSLCDFYEGSEDNVVEVSEEFIAKVERVEREYEEVQRELAELMKAARG